jgi:putative DNA methylase
MSRRRLPPRSLLDAGVLPVGEIARMAKRESVRPRDAYQAHKWFARRLAATARSLLVGSTTVGDGNFWKAYYGEASCEGLTVLDPFMGGGVMLLGLPASGRTSMALTSSRSPPRSPTSRAASPGSPTCSRT